jgi:hypothetical protein
MHSGDLLPVDLGQVRVDQGCRRRRDPKRPLELGLPGLEELQFVLQRLDRCIVIGDELDQLAGPALYARQIRFLALRERFPVRFIESLG